MVTSHRPRARSDVFYRCRACEATSLRWVGRCPSCGAWNTFEPSSLRSRPTRPGVAATGPAAVTLADISTEAARPLTTGVSELDRVLGGGVVGGSVTLLYGPPGIGKSTLLFQVLSSVAAAGVDVMLASAEESLVQVRGRASRIGQVPRRLLALEGPNLEEIEAAVERHHPALLVVDSLQSIADPELAQPAGALAQVRGCVERLTRMAKSTGVPLLVVGHVTKDGDVAGPRAVEHLVDTVLSFDGDRHHSLRVLTSVKHRFGPTGEVGIFEMRDDGLRAVSDPGPLMLGDRMAFVPGSAVAPVLQGRRPLLVEVQALLGPVSGGAARPHTLGIDAARANLLVAVLACRTAVRVPEGAEFFVAAVGGISVTEPAADLAVALALASVVVDQPLPPDVIAFGELGLAGEVRMVPGAERRLAEAYRAGFTRAIVPASTVGPGAGTGAADGTDPCDTASSIVPSGMVVHGVRTLSEALALAVSEAGAQTRPGTMPGWPTLPAAASL